jgi:ubiquitin-protein ligase
LLLSFLSLGPEDTPYANGCFLFDIWVSDYPKTAPKVKFLTTGQGRVRFNPNLYNCGKVCLSLLGTWSGPGWQPNKSTLLQVLVSIQGLILVPDPYFNEPGFAHGRGKKTHDAQSDAYNKNIRKFTLEYAIDAFLMLAISKQAKRDYSEFSDVIAKHFYERAYAIEAQLAQWCNDDSSIRPLAERVRKNLRKLVEQCKAPRAAANAPPAATIVTID